MSRKTLAIMLGLIVGLLIGVAAISERSNAADGNCYARETGPSTLTICN